MRLLVKGEGRFVPDSLRGSAYPLVVFAVRVREMPARPTQFVLKAFARLAQLSFKRGRGQVGQVSMRERMRSHFDAVLRQRPQFGPIHRPPFLEIQPRAPDELRNVQRSTDVGKRGTRKNGCRNVQ